MIIYKDKISGDEMLSDVFNLQEVDDLYFEVKGKRITETTGVDESVYGGNASAEVADEGAEDASVSGIDIVIRHQLVETNFDKKSFQTYIKKYAKDLLVILKKEDEENGTDRAKVFQTGMPKLVKKILGSFKNWEFYTGESMNNEAMVGLLNWKEGDELKEGEDSYPYMIFFKDGLSEEKV